MEPVDLTVRETAAAELHLTASVRRAGGRARDQAVEAYDAIGAALEAKGAQVVHERLFASLATAEEVREGRRQALESHGLESDNPVTYVEGEPLWEGGLAGVHLCAAVPSSDVNISTLSWQGQGYGRILRMPGARFIFLSNVHGLGRGSKGQEARTMFERAEDLLRSVGASFRDVAKTWIYISNILDWYGDFNAARNEQFRRFGLVDEGRALYLPASTGIEGRNPLGAACVMDVLAVRSEEPGGAVLRPLVSPRQSEAFEYGSAFARGMCVEAAGVKRLCVSGTAAIDKAGRSLLPGDLEGQIAVTLEIVEALLGREGATLRDLSQTTLFFQRHAATGLRDRAGAVAALDDLPAVWTVADICRKELLFEMDAVAVVDRTQPVGS